MEISCRRLVLLLLICSFAVAAVAAVDPPEEWLTVAEKSGFRATASHAETLAFLDRVAAESKFVRHTTFGRSGQGRELPLVIVSKEGLFTPEAAHAAGKAVLLIQSCIHPGEVAGKSASLMILRDIALGKRPDLLDAGVLLFAPIYNADGHEKVSPLNRANQNGPVDGMGFRTTTTGLDLNRDHMKIDSPEARALVSLVNRWNPHLHVDNHVTDGSRHRWVLTWSRAEAPQLAPSLSDWLDAAMPSVLEATEEAGWPTGPYPSLIDRTDPAKGIDSSVAGPRYSTGYFTLRNRVSILVEMYAYAPFENRVRANRSFLENLILEVGHSPEELVRATRAAEARTVAAGTSDAPSSNTVLSWKSTLGGTVEFPVCSYERRESVVMGGPMVIFDCSEDDPVLTVPWRHRPSAVATTPRPHGYLVGPGWPEIRDRLVAHGLRIERLTEATEMTVETLRLSRSTLAQRSYQGRIRISELEVTRADELRTMAAGSLWIPADQPLFELAVQLLEPEAPDSFLRWGLMHSVFERKEYIGLTKLETLAASMLKGPGVRRQWSEALADENFAQDVGARYLWWYCKTEYWDEGVGLMPVFRVMTPPALETEPW